MKWQHQTISPAIQTLGVLLTLLGSQGSACAEDLRSACATAAEQAQQLRSEHKLLEARSELLVCAQSLCPTVVRSDCVHWISELDKALPTVVIKATGPANEDLIDVAVWVDKVRVLDKLDGLARAVNPGIHVFRFEANGLPPVEQQVLVREGENRRMLVVQFDSGRTITAATGAPRISVLPLAFAGAGALALGGFAYFGVTGRAEASDLASGCGATKTCTEEQVDPVRRKLLIADVALGISLASLGVATYLFFSQYRARPKETASLQVGPGSVRLDVNF